MKLLAWFQIVAGVAVVALWSVLLLTGQVPEVQDGRTDIWFHVAAEGLLAGLLLVGGLALLRRARRASLLSALALGALVYSAVNSSGYYAEAGEWAPVAGFAVIVAVAAAALVVLIRGNAEPTASRPAETVDADAREEAARPRAAVRGGRS